ncbi:MAG TPA: general secretion pathway protein GspK [Sedimenticola sp.]|nr:general secretion pathway protein GspK [Sedimenticola sp.]
MAGSGRDRQPQAGVALVLVLWVIALLTIVAVSQVTTQRTELGMTLNSRQEQAGRAAVEAGMNYVLWHLLRGRGDTRPRTGWPRNGQPREWSFAGHRIRVRAVPESARIDLNHAGSGLLAGLLRAAGLGPDRVARVRDAILDWRDPDNDRHLNGAELRDYRAAGLPYGARNGAFETVDELRRVLGVDPALFERIAPALTVYSGRRSINPIYASPLVLRSLPGMAGSQVNAYLESRRQRLALGQPVLLPVGVSASDVSDKIVPVYRIRAEARMPDGIRVSGEMVVKLNSRRVYEVLDRTYPLPPPADDREKAGGQEAKR